MKGHYNLSRTNVAVSFAHLSGREHRVCDLTPVGRGAKKAARKPADRQPKLPKSTKPRFAERHYSQGPASDGVNFTASLLPWSVNLTD